jgi:hypothetical protein
VGAYPIKNGLMSSSSPNHNLPDNRGDYKLKAARRHFDNLRQIEDIAGSLVSSNDRMYVEMEIDESLYNLVGVKDALLQEINCKFNLGLSPDEVWTKTINAELRQKIEPDAKEDLMKDICHMESNKNHQLWLINELHNHSKHRAIITKAITMVIDRKETSVALINPRTNMPMRTNEGKLKPIIEYLEESYAEIEDLQKKVREKIRLYRNSMGT